MKKFSALLLLAGCLLLVVLAGCKKNISGPKDEEKLVVQTTPAANGHLEAPAPGPNFTVNVTITSAMPSAGVKIDIVAKPDGGTTAFFTSTQNTTNRSNDFSITGTTQGVVSVVTITVTSLSTSSNTWTGSYKYSRK